MTKVTFQNYWLKADGSVDPISYQKATSLRLHRKPNESPPFIVIVWGDGDWTLDKGLSSVFIKADQMCKILHFENQAGLKKLQEEAETE